MFDDQQPKNPGQVPANLPIGEPPEDMFASTETEAQVAPASSAASALPPVAPASSAGGPVPTSPSALEAGILRPKQPMAGLPPQAGVAPQGASEMYRIKEPSIGRGILVTVIVVVVAVILGGGGWYLYQRFVVRSSSQSFNPAFTFPQPVGQSALEAPAVAPVAPPAAEEGNVVETPESGNINAEIKDQKILFGEPIDTDGDGLDDATEIKLGTDPKNWDTDSDGLSDGDEIKIWHTDPLKSDTDSDGYADGVEVKNGYNPNGAGKLFQPPTTTSQ